jgi:hypothetical protein
MSIKNYSWFIRPEEEGDGNMVSQEMLIKMVRNHPALRWLRSNLLEENIAMLQQERHLCDRLVDSMSMDASEAILYQQGCMISS